jgi:hypothetical protein
MPAAEDDVEALSGVRFEARLLRRESIRAWLRLATSVAAAPSDMSVSRSNISHGSQSVAGQLLELLARDQVQKYAAHMLAEMKWIEALLKPDA